MSRLSLKIVSSFFGDFLIITDNESRKTAEIMALQLDGIAKTSKTMGSLPHGGWEKNDDVITIYHDEDRDNHKVSFTLKEIKALI